MADKKISALTSATTPLAGTEVLPIVQSSATVKVATNDLTVRNVRANATTGILQVTGPGTGTTRVMTTPNANFTAARTDAEQTFVGNQTISGGDLTVSSSTATTLNLNLTNTKAAGQGDAYFNITKAANGNSNGFQLITGASQKWIVGTGITAVNDNFKIYNANTSAIAIEIPVAATNVNINTGNLVISTSGKGFTLPGGITWTSGAGSPEGVVTAPVGSLYSRSDGGLLTSLYVKESGAGNTGWVGK